MEMIIIQYILGIITIYFAGMLVFKVYEFFKFLPEIIKVEGTLISENNGRKVWELKKIGLRFHLVEYEKQEKREKNDKNKS